MDRIPPKKIAEQITSLLKKQRPDKNYIRKVFEYVRTNLDLRGTHRNEKKLPELLTEEELKCFYDKVWSSSNRAHMILVKMLLYTGVRNSELSNITLQDIDLKGLKIRISKGKGEKDRYVLIPETFRGELTQYICSQKEKEARYLFETSRLDKYSDRWIREIVRRYAIKAGIKKRIYPHLFRHQLLTYLTQKGLIDSKLQLLSGHKERQSLAMYQNLSLADVEKEYNEAMKDFPIK